MILKFLQSICVFLCLVHCKKTFILKVNQGQIDLTKHDFENIPIVKIYGNFGFYYGKLASEIEQGKLNVESFLEVPKSWTVYGYPSFGYGTYELNILLSEEQQDLAIYIPDAATSFRLVWNGKVIENVGNVATNSNEYEPSYKTKIVLLSEVKKNNKLFIEVANYTHHKAGLWEAIYLGKHEDLQKRNNLKNSLYSFIIGAGGILGLYHIGLFRSKRKETLEVLFALFCFNFSVYTFFLNYNLTYSVFSEIKWTLLIRFNYFFAYLAGIFLILFYERLFPKIFSILLLGIYILSFLILSLCVLILPVYYFTQTLPFNFVLNIGFFTYVFLKILTSVHPRNFQYYLTLISLGILIFTLILDSLSLQQILPLDSTLILGNLFFISSHAYILSIRFSKALITVENLATRLRRSNERLRYLKSQLEDMVEKRTAELIRERTRAELIGRMTTEIVHDLKNPITAIIGFSGLANTDNIGREARQEYLEMIYAESMKLADLSQSILDYVKGGSKIQKVKVDLQKYFQEINKLLNHEFKISTIEYKFELLTEQEGYFDPDLMRRVILNIASNSLDALLKDKKQKKIFSVKVSSSQNYLQFEFSDNGTGIPKEVQPLIFEPFVTYGKKSGTGLGMALVKEIVELHSGEIYFHSIEGEGTTLFIKLPLEQIT